MGMIAQPRDMGSLIWTLCDSASRSASFRYLQTGFTNAETSMDRQLPMADTTVEVGREWSPGMPAMLSGFLKV